MRVLFDHQVFDSQTVEGPSRYFVELAHGLEGLGVNVEFAVRETDNVFLQADPRWSKNIVPHQRENPWLKRLRHWGVKLGVVPYMATFRANQDASEAALATGNFDIFHPTYYEPYFLPLLNGKPFVLTVHDMIHELFPQYVKPGNPTTDWKKKTIAAAAHIIAVSETTKQDLIRLFNVAPERITVVHHGVGRPFTDAAVSPPAGGGARGGGRAGEKNYLLYLGSRDRYKNFSCLLAALPAIIRTNDLHLVCVGGGAFTKTEIENMRKRGVDQRVTQTSADDAQLAELYRGAKAFIFPSLYEGFGMPILEAMACGCPVVLSRASAFTEIGAEAALYFDPNKPENLAHVVNELLASSDLQTKLRTAGRARGASFTWKRAAEHTLAVYKRVLEPI